MEPDYCSIYDGREAAAGRSHGLIICDPSPWPSPLACSSGYSLSAVGMMYRPLICKHFFFRSYFRVDIACQYVLYTSCALRADRQLRLRHNTCAML